VSAPRGNLPSKALKRVQPVGQEPMAIMTKFPLQVSSTLLAEALP